MIFLSSDVYLVVPERKSDNAEIDSNVKQNVKPPQIEKPREAMVVESEEDKALFSQNAWSSKSKSKKELEIHRKTLLDKKVCNLLFNKVCKRFETTHILLKLPE